RYGSNTAEVTVFIETDGRLSPSRWRKVMAARKSVTRVTRNSSSQPAEIVRASLAGAPDGTGSLLEPMSNVAADMAAILAKRSKAHLRRRGMGGGQDGCPRRPRAQLDG